MISSISGPCLALKAKKNHFINDFDSLMTLAARYDTYILRFADFLWTTTTTTTTRLLYPLAHARGVIIQM